MSNLGYVLGVLVGDGTLVLHRAKKNGGGVHYTIRLATASKSFADKFAEAINQLTKKKVQRHMRRPFRQTFPSGKTYNCREQFIVKIYSKLWFYRFSKLIEQIREGCFPLHYSEASSFIKGFYDSEGWYSVDKYPNRICYQLGITNSNIKLLKLSQELIKFLTGINLNLRTYSYCTPFIETQDHVKIETIQNLMGASK